MQKIGKFVVVAAAALSLAACGQDAKTETAAPAGPAVPSSNAAPATQSKGRECTADDIKTTGKFGEKPEITVPDDCDPPKKLITKDLSGGTGPAAAAGQKLKMNYLLVTWSDKKVLDNSYDRGEPFDLNLGAGEVIPGWDQGLTGIKQGGRRLLIIPPDLAYGEGGRGIKPNETLVFVTDAVSVADNRG
ncbi:FKBP-type peptidyl-prolyl cis-trans isomerase [Amycolatopsis sp. SID8362]|uniref:FKBP-type peptidyl-prolyl cis-trans isomerase n=1 Tax=Amycolatopsis sp. SID8362 TaxID=2690346 RepID=UPI00136E6F49|nr:FKBP-type peptidyl-prolyl cis-trans isomerase [Amycolatopsis sp. SID8362]NBH08330.1 FKBP-type peptidyl-prolyl cis-trans isomerase [Amycolatopsis sp. SID8362]NED45025.1 FKBP-type peptidyl-prolyl cis-trans isomerase [Amycolatopsis sp. SID8362]